MRILLQQKNTGLFFRDIDRWVSASSEAMDFVSSSAAIDFCVANRLAGLQLVFKFEDQPYEIVCQLSVAAEPQVERPARMGPHSL